MAKKKEQKLEYLQVPLPSGQRQFKTTKIDWLGLNKGITLDSGELSYESNISTNEYPYITPSRDKAVYAEDYYKPIGMFGFDDFLIVIYCTETQIKIQYIKGEKSYTAVLQNDLSTADIQRSVVKFNVYDTPTDPIGGKYVEKLLIFPDKKSIDFHSTLEGTAISSTINTIKLGYNSSPIADYYNGFGITITGGSGAGQTNVITDYVTGSQEAVATVSDYWGTQPDNTSTYLLEGITVANLDAPVKYFVDETDTAIAYSGQTTTNIHLNYSSRSVAGYYVGCTISIISGTGSPQTKTITGYSISGQNPIATVDTPWTTNPDGTSVYHIHGAVGGSYTIIVPEMKYVTVYNSRLFGVDDVRVYASGFNDYTNWNLDTINDASAGNAWVSPVQSNVKALGSFTGITTYGGHVILFKNDYMHEVYNTKNPFRIVDVYNEGSIDNRSIQEVDGKLIFVDEDAVKVYTGGNPQIISAKLNVKTFSKAVSGTDGRRYYLYCKTDKATHNLFVYDTMNGLWSEEKIDHEVLSFAHTSTGMYMLLKISADYGRIDKLDSDFYESPWSFETDMYLGHTIDIKHMKKIQLLADIEAGSALSIYCIYDDEVFDPETSQLLYAHTNSSEAIERVPVRVLPRKTACYGFKLRFSGTGYVKIYQMEITMAMGGELLG